MALPKALRHLVQKRGVLLMLALVLAAAGGAWLVAGYRSMLPEGAVFEQLTRWAPAALGAGAALFIGMLLLGRGGPTGSSFGLILEDLAETESTDDLFELMAPCPARPDMPPADQGWNRLLGVVDQLRQDADLAAAQAALQNAAAGQDAPRLSVLIDALPDGVVLADAGGNVVLANRACEGHLGRPRQEIAAASLWTLFPDDKAQAVLRDVLEQKSRGTEVTFDIRLSAGGDAAEASGADSPTAEADETTVLRVFCRHVEPDAENSDIILIVRDVSQQVMAEAGRDAFIAHVSHEFRSPLTNIRAYTETLLSDMVLDAETQKEAFNVINEETGRLTRLVNDVLNVSRLESGSVVLEKGEVMLDRLVRQCTRDVNASAVEKGLTLQTTFHPKLPNIYADREKLAVVINNILTNAIKYTPEGGTVFVETQCDEQFVYVKVADTGMGIAPDDLENVFRKFYRVERPETADITGSGLGLATAREIVRLHGGNITLASQLGQGSTFTVKLPATQTGPVLGPPRSGGGQVQETETAS